MLIFIIVISTIFWAIVVNFRQTLEKLTGENGVTDYKILIEDSERPANYGGLLLLRVLFVETEIAGKPFAIFVVPDASHNCRMPVIV